MVSRNEPRPRKRVIPLKMLLASLEPKAKTWHADPASRPLPPVQRDLRQQALAHRQQPPKPPQLDPYIPPDVEAPQPQLTASSNDPPLLIFDRPEEGAQQLAALCPSSPHPLPLGNWVFSSCTHLYEAARFDPALEPEIFQHVIRAPTARDARIAGQLFGNRRRKEWTESKALAIMRAACALKMALYPPLAELLLATGDRQLWVASDADDLFWQIGTTEQVGRNEMGRLLQDLRARLRSERENGYTDVLQAVLAIIPPSTQQAPAPSPSQPHVTQRQQQQYHHDYPVESEPNKAVRFADA